jgi:hypothetical protein
MSDSRLAIAEAMTRGRSRSLDAAVMVVDANIEQHAIRKRSRRARLLQQP